MTAINLFNPAHLVLELPESILETSWNQTQGAATANSRWQSYLNRVVLAAFIPWLQSEEEEISVKASMSKPVRENIWELVNGTSITYGDAKLVLVPFEAEDTSEFRVSREWLDIPQWAADYYLAVQVNVDEGYLRIWGYTTHEKLKNEGIYSSGDRSYVLSEDKIITDLDVLWVTRELCPDEVTQAAISPLPEISTARANNLIERLGDSSLLLPRLTVPFETWAALIQNSQWCQKLVARRRGAAQTISVVQWLQKEVASLSEEVTKLTELGWRQLEFQPSMVGARDATTEDNTALALAKQITVENRPYELKILPVVEEPGTWRFELRSLSLGGTIPAGFKLRLLSEDMETFEGNEDVATEAVEQLYLEVDLEVGEGLIWQVEPTPNNYQPEVLRF